MKYKFLNTYQNTDSALGRNIIGGHEGHLLPAKKKRKKTRKKWKGKR